MTSQLEWIEQASGQSRQCRAMIIGWQNSVYAIGQLMQIYNNLTLHPEPNQDPQNPMRIIAARRQILASLLELKNKLDKWIGNLNKAGLDCSSINTVRKSFRTALDQAEVWRNIRNLTFHYGDVVEPADDLLATYRAISCIGDADVNSVWKAMVKVGLAARDIALKSANQE